MPVDEIKHSPENPQQTKRDKYEVASICGFIIIVGALVLLIWLPASFRAGFFGITWFVYTAAVVGLFLVIYGQAGKRKVNRQGKG
jgi:hypothetical protein